MQTALKDALLKRAKELFEDGTVDRAFGWKQGEFSYDTEPKCFLSYEDLEKNFVYNAFCGPNFSKYLIKATKATESKVLVYLKPCDTYSFNQLLTEHRFLSEKVYAIAVPCDGCVSNNKLKAQFGEIASVEETDGTVTVHTIYDGDKTVAAAEILSERCVNCKSKKPVAYDEIIGEEGAEVESGRFDAVAKLEAMTPDERFAFWQNELSRCIRCNACRDVCPACTCESCVFNNPKSGVENKAAANSFEEKMFHIIRAFHVAGRCTDCGECSRVCPQQIPLHLLNRKFIKDINGFYGTYQAGETVGSRAPLVDYTEGDLEPCEAVGREEA